MSASLVIVFGLTSIIFLSMMLLGLALFMRKQWDELGRTPRRRSARDDYSAS